MTAKINKESEKLDMNNEIHKVHNYIRDYTKISNGSVQGFAFNVVNNTTFNTTINNTLDVTVQWGSANASNSIYSDIFILNKTY